MLAALVPTVEVPPREGTVAKGRVDTGQGTGEQRPPCRLKTQRGIWWHLLPLGCEIRR